MQAVSKLVVLQDLESEEQTISFSKNGQDHGVAFKLSESIKGKALFPHVFTRNVVVSVNFGAEVLIVNFCDHYIEHLGRFVSGSSISTSRRLHLGAGSC